MSNTNGHMVDSYSFHYRKSFDIYSRNIKVDRYSYNDLVNFGQKTQRSFKMHDDDVAVYTQKNPITGFVEQLIVYADRVDIFPNANDRRNVISIPTVAYPLTTFNLFA